VEYKQKEGSETFLIVVQASSFDFQLHSRSMYVSVFVESNTLKFSDSGRTRRSKPGGYAHYGEVGLSSLRLIRTRPWTMAIFIRPSERWKMEAMEAFKFKLYLKILSASEPET